MRLFIIYYCGILMMEDREEYLPKEDFLEEVAAIDKFVFGRERSEGRKRFLEWCYTNLEEPEKPCSVVDIPQYLGGLADKIEKGREEYLNPKWMKYLDGLAALAPGIEVASNALRALPVSVLMDVLAAALASSPFLARKIRKYLYKKKNPELEEAFREGLASYLRELKDAFEDCLIGHYYNPDMEAYVEV